MDGWGVCEVCKEDGNCKLACSDCWSGGGVFGAEEVTDLCIISRVL